MYLSVQLIGFIGLALGVLAFQFKQHRHIVLCKMASELVFSLQYLLLGAWTAALLDFTSATRNFLFCSLVRKGRSTKPLIYVFAAFAFVSLLFCSNKYSLCV